MRFSLLTREEVADLQTRLEIATRGISRILELVEVTGPWNAQFGLDEVRCIAQNVQGALESPYLYEEGDQWG